MQNFIQEYKPIKLIYQDAPVYMVNYDIIRDKIYASNCEVCRDCLEFRDYETIETAAHGASEYLLYILDKYGYKCYDGELFKYNYMDESSDNCVFIGSIDAIKLLSCPRNIRHYNSCCHRTAAN